MRPLLVFWFSLAIAGLPAFAGTKALLPPMDVITMVEPVYPDEAVQRKLEGEVEVTYDVRTDGTVQNVVTMGEADKLLQDAVAAAMAQRRYNSYKRKNYENNDVYFHLCYEFKLPQNPNEKPSVKRVSPPMERWSDKIPPAVYPFELLKQKKSGKAEVTFLTGPDGRVEKISITEYTHREFGLAIQAQVEALKMPVPRDRKGRYQPTYLFFRQTFSVEKASEVPIGDLTRKLALSSPGQAPRVFAKEELDQAPVPIRRVAPEYPVALLEKGPKGESTIAWVIDESGVPQAVQIIATTKPEFGYAAAQAVSQWRYQPGLKAGAAVPTAAQMTFEFKLEP